MRSRISGRRSSRQAFMYAALSVLLRQPTSRYAPMRGCANARSRQYFSYFAFFSARDPGDVIARMFVFAIFYPIDVPIRSERANSTIHCEYYFEFIARSASLYFLFPSPVSLPHKSFAALLF